MKNVFYDLKIENSISVHCKYFCAQNNNIFLQCPNFQSTYILPLHCVQMQKNTAQIAVEIQFTVLLLHFHCNLTVSICSVLYNFKAYCFYWRIHVNFQSYQVSVGEISVIALHNAGGPSLIRFQLLVTIFTYAILCHFLRKWGNSR